MLNQLIRLSLRNRPIVLALAILLLVLGVQTTRELPLEVLPEMTKPAVTMLTESPGLAPVPQLRIVVNRDRTKACGVQPGAINEQLSTSAAQ